MRLFALLLILTSILAGHAAPPPPSSPAQLLPADTLAVVSVPDWDAAKAAWSRLPQSKLWDDPALQPIREKLRQHEGDQLTDKLQRTLGLRFSEWKDLLHGQVTLALTPAVGPKGSAGFGWLILVDTKGGEGSLKAQLADLKKKWSENGRTLRSLTLQGTECTALRVDHQENGTGSASADRGPADVSTTRNSDAPVLDSEILIAQAGSLLVLGNAPRDLERVLARHSGGLVACLADQGAFQEAQAAVFRESVAFAWLDFGTLFGGYLRQLSPPGGAGSPESPLGLHWDRLLAASGLSAVTTIAAQLQFSADGASAEVRLKVPAAQRRGLFSLLAVEAKEAAPPEFVGTDVVKFKRWRMDGPKTWATLESLLVSASPELAGLVQMGLEAAGKDRDPDFNLRQTLLGSLGDDFIALEKSPSEQRPAPTLYLIGSPKPEQLVQALKAGSALLPLANNDPTVAEREFLGRKIYSLTLSGGSRATQLNFAATAGYAAVATDGTTLEEFLRNSQGTAKPLRARPGLLEAGEKVGGMGTGLFGYTDLAESVRLWLEDTRTQGASLRRLLNLAPLAAGHSLGTEERKKLNEWWDPSLLPPFEKISKYCSFAVYTLRASSDGLRWRVFVPAPPGL